VNSEDLKYFKDFLTNRLDNLLKEGDKTVEGMADSSETYPDPADRATAEADTSFMLRIRDREHKLISKINKALKRIDNDKFGICEVCSEDISMERLKARPVTTLCIDCKLRQEKEEKIKGL